MLETTTAPRKEQQAGPRLWTGKTRGGSFGHRAIRWVLPRFGLGFVYGITACAVPFYMLFARKGYGAIAEYFRDIHGYRGWKLFKAVYRNHYFFAQGMMDRFALMSGMADKFTIRVDGADTFDKVLNNPTGLLVIGGHLGNMEMAGMSFESPTKPINVLVFGQEEASLQEARTKCYAMHGLHLIPVLPDMSHLFAVHAALRKGEVALLHGDRSLLGRKTLPMNFLGKKALFPTGVFHLAVNAGCNMVTMFMMREKKARHYTVYIRELKASENPDKGELIRMLCGSYVRALENMLLKYPEQWYNFYRFWEEEK